MNKNYKEILGKINRILTRKKKNFDLEDHKPEFLKSLADVSTGFDKLDTEFYSTEVNLESALDEAESTAKSKGDNFSEIDFGDMASEDFDSGFHDFVTGDIETWFEEAINFLEEGFYEHEDYLSDEDKVRKKELFETFENILHELFIYSKKDREVPTLDKNQEINSRIRDVEKALSDVNEAHDEIRGLEYNRENLDPDDEDYSDEYANLESEISEAEKTLERADECLTEVYNDIEMEASEIKSTLKKITNAREDFHGEVMNALAGAEETFDNLLHVLMECNEDYVLKDSMKFLKYSGNSDIESFVKKKEAEDLIAKEVEVKNKGLKLNKMVWFNDDSIIFLDKENKPFSWHNETLKDVKDFCRAVISHELRKIPKWEPVFQEYFTSHCEKKNHSFTDVIDNIEGLKQYNNVFKQQKIEPYKMEADKRTRELIKVPTYKNLEKFMDGLDAIKKHSAINKIVAVNFSGKYKELLNDKSYQHFETWYDNGIDGETIKKELAGKIAAFKDSESINNALKNITNNLLGWGCDSYLRKAKKCGAEILHHSDDALIVKIPTYKASQEMGSQSWCISRTESMFKNYTAHHDQYFVYDFNRPPEDVRSLVGITINSQSGGFKASHLKNDKGTTLSAQSDWVSAILLHEKDSDKNALVNALSHFSNNYTNLFVDFFEENKEKIKALGMNGEQIEKVLSPLSDEQMAQIKKSSENKSRKTLKM